MLEKIQKKVEDLRIKVYAGQNNEDTEKYLYDIEQMIFKAMDEALKISSKPVLADSCQHNWLKSHSRHMLYCGSCGKYKPEGS